jgi:hypothetical protein
MRLLVIVSLLVLATSSAERPIREGYAVTYYSRDDASPGIVFIATTRRGLTLSDTRDPKSLNAWVESLRKPAKPFYIKVFTDHITATDTESNTTATIALRNLVRIEWKK